MTSILDSEEGCYEAMAVSDRGPRRDVRRGHFGRAGGAAGKLGTGHLGGLAPCGGRCDLARHVSPLPAPPQPAGRGELTGGGEEPGARVASTAGSGPGPASGGDGSVTSNDQLD